MQDLEPPEVIGPGDLEVQAQAMDGAIVEWEIVATDNCDANVTVRCDPPSGSFFPVGTTLVRCAAVDSSGNRAFEGFTVTVSTRPVDVELAADPSMVLRWYVEAEPQETPSLDSPIEWEPVTVPIERAGEERSLTYPLTAGSRFFRLVSQPLGPPPDSDGDGVPNAQDKCPDTLEGAMVDDCGCALLQLARHPAQAADPAVNSLRSVIKSRQAQSVIFTATVYGIEVNLGAMNQALGLIRGGMISVAGAPDGVDLFNEAVTGARDAHGELLETILPFPTNVLKAICLHLRVAPIQRFPPVSSGPFVLHHPDAYEHSGTLWLEEGTRGWPSSTAGAKVSA